MQCSESGPVRGQVLRVDRDQQPDLTCPKERVGNRNKEDTELSYMLSTILFSLLYPIFVGHCFPGPPLQRPS